MPEQRNQSSQNRGDRGRGGRGRERERDRREQEGPTLDERVVDIGRTAKVTKGGRNFTFRAVVVVGDNAGNVGMGVGKAREVPEAIRKGTERARKMMVRIPLAGGTIPHPIVARFGATEVMLKPATPGTGVIAGGGVRAVLECAGVRDVLTKSLGSANKLNVVRATIQALQQMKNVEVEASRRNKPVIEMIPPWRRENGGGEQ